MEDNKKKIRAIISKFYNDIANYENVIFLNDKGDEKFNGYYLDNYPSILIFLAYYNKFTNSKKATPLIYRYLSYLVKSLKKTKNISLSFTYGLTGSLYALEIIKKVGEINIDLSNIQTNYEEMLYSRLKIINNKIISGKLKSLDYDFINGLCSNLKVLLMFSKNKVLIKESINTLCECTRYIMSNSQESCDLGVAHGIGGVMLTLVNAYRYRIDDKNLNNKIRESLEKISNLYIKIYKTKKGTLNKILANPWNDEVYFNKSDPTIYTRRQSWCYGTPGIAYGLWKTARVLKDHNLERFTIKIFNNLNMLNIHDTQLLTPTFCHGLTGLLSIILMLEKDSPLNLKGIKNKICDKLLNQYNVNKKFCFRDYDYISRGKKYSNNREFLDLGLLNGSTGCILILMSLLDLDILSWTDVFLL